MPTDIVLAADRLRARDSGRWAEEKLSFLDQYLPPALQATRAKRERHYVDLFAGPGRNVDARRSGLEFDGGALRVLGMRAVADPSISFTHAAFVNLDPEDHDALRERCRRLIESGKSRIPGERIANTLGDANDCILPIMAKIHPKSYAFVFADIERPEHWPFASVTAIRAAGHESVDFCVLFPLGMAINRLISYQLEHTERCAGVLTAFFGTERWRELAVRRITDRQSPELRRGLQQLYMDQLRTLWRDVQETRDVRYRGRHQLYKLLLASDHAAAKNIARWEEKKAAEREQFGLF